MFVSSYILHACFCCLYYFYIIASVTVLMLLYIRVYDVLRPFNKYSILNKYRPHVDAANIATLLDMIE